MRGGNRLATVAMMNAPVIDRTVRIDGLVEVEGDLIVEGRVDGRIIAGGHVTIAITATCRASIRSPRLTVAGELIGNAVCTESITVGSGARVVGDLRAPDVAIAANSEVDGQIDLLPPEPSTHSIDRQTIGSAKGLRPSRPVPPGDRLDRTIPSPPRPSGRLRINARGETP